MQILKVTRKRYIEPSWSGCLSIIIWRYLTPRYWKVPGFSSCYPATVKLEGLFAIYFYRLGIWDIDFQSLDVLQLALQMWWSLGEQDNLVSQVKIVELRWLDRSTVNRSSKNSLTIMKNGCDDNTHPSLTAAVTRTWHRYAALNTRMPHTVFRWSGRFLRDSPTPKCSPDAWLS